MISLFSFAANSHVDVSHQRQNVVLGTPSSALSEAPQSTMIENIYVLGVYLYIDQKIVDLFLLQQGVAMLAIDNEQPL